MGRSKRRNRSITRGVLNSSSKGRRGGRLLFGGREIKSQEIVKWREEDIIQTKGSLKKQYGYQTEKEKRSRCGKGMYPDKNKKLMKKTL